MSSTRPNPTIVNPQTADDFPAIDVWANQNAHRDFVITIRVPEFTSVCPMTGLPDFGQFVIDYIPDQGCVELKAFKYYMLAYRNFGMFYESIANKILDDIVQAAKPRWIRVRGEFLPRGGINTGVVLEWQQSGFTVPTQLITVPSTPIS
jgi:7-cyano-7-deazaguanine reductase